LGYYKTREYSLNDYFTIATLSAASVKFVSLA